MSRQAQLSHVSHVSPLAALILIPLCYCCSPVTNPQSHDTTPRSTEPGWQAVDPTTAPKTNPKTNPETNPETNPAGVPDQDTDRRDPGAHRFAAPPDGAARDEARAHGWANDRQAPPTRLKAEANTPGPNTQAPGESYGGITDRGEPSRSAESMGSAPSVEGRGGGTAYEPAPRPRPRDDRPGLGTTWGETRYSSVTEVPFERDSSSPTYSGTLWYNDARGAAAMARDEGDHGRRQAQLFLGGRLSAVLRNDYGSPLEAVRAGNKLIAIGAAGSRYSISLRNDSPERFEVVVSVDGLDVLDGRPAGFGKRGYLVEPYATVDIEGFRQSEAAVAAFRFGAVSDSYAAKTGAGRNVGVIGLAAFAERGYYSRAELERRRQADPFPNKWSNPPTYMAR